MEKYKVMFNNNKAISAAKHVGMEGNLKIAHDGARTSIEYFILYAHDEHDAMQFASRLVNEYFYTYL